MILVADTDRRLHSLLEKDSDFTHEWIHCGSFSSAVGYAEKQKVRLVIVCQNLGDRQGLELLSHFQHHFPRIPAIFVADDCRKETIISAMRRGAKDFLEWPVDSHSLISSIRRIERTYLGSSNLNHGAMKSPTSEVGGESGKRHAGFPADVDRHFDVEVFFFGSFKVVINGNNIAHWPSRKARSIFAYLVYNDSKATFRELLIDQFWPKVFPESARNCLNVAIHHIRQIFQRAGVQQNALLLENDCYSFNSVLRISSDVKRFLTHWNRFRFLKLDNRPSPAVNELELAASIYKRDFMQDDIYEEWTIPERENLREIYLGILENLSRVYGLNGKPDTAIEICKSILEKDDCREKVHRRLMLCYHRIGERDHALRQFHKCSEILKRELDVGPSNSTVELYRKIRDDTLRIPRIR